MNAPPRRREGASSLLAWTRQRRFPAEFRILPPAVGPDTVAGPAHAATLPVAAPGPTAPAPPAPLVPDDLPDDVMAGLVTEIWRARNRVDGPGAEEDPPRAVRWVNRHLGAAADRLADAGIEVEGHDGLRFDVGMDLHVLAYQDDPDVVEETVVETIRPSVRRAGRVIQMGEVIVAVPETKET
ncbi:hypothetical protein APR04_000455 [Promicromonospora umidemergens]|uniref:GrpE protein n=1 Tax=Promicromonospora umidemergens TaxID=629679 RepID=A0ABP8X8F5_9MICO|nr:hypothetical protein [Promicromonospora umidemergens]MCP2281566.1 hypothetical protein [Promicromonospora umidemergens]